MEGEGPLPQAWGNGTRGTPWGPREGGGAVGLRCDGCECGGTRESRLSWKCQ